VSIRRALGRTTVRNAADVENEMRLERVLVDNYWRVHISVVGRRRRWMDVYVFLSEVK
jgi:hypothetical protein